MSRARSRSRHESRETPCAAGARSKGKGKSRVGRGGCTPKSGASMELHRAREVLWREVCREKALHFIRLRHMPPALVQEQKLMIKNIHRVLREESSHQVVIKWTMTLIENQVADRLFLSC